MLRNQYRDLILGIIGDTNRRFPDLMIDDLINIERTNVIKWARPSNKIKWYYFATAIGTARYNLADIITTDTDFMMDEFTYRYQNMVTVKSKPLDSYSVYTADIDFPNWDNLPAGEPNKIIQIGRTIVLSPTPSVDNDRVEVIGLLRPNVLVDDVTMCDLPMEYQTYVIRLVCAELKQDLNALQALETELKAMSNSEKNRGRPLLNQRIGINGVNR